MDRTQKAALLSAGIGLVVTALKFYAAWLTGSLALAGVLALVEPLANMVAHYHFERWWARRHPVRLAPAVS